MLKKEKNTFTTRIIYKISMSIWSEKYLQRGIAEYIKIIFCHKYPYIFLLRCEPAAQAAVFYTPVRRRPYYCNTNTQTCRVAHSMGATMGKNGGTILDSLPSTQVSEPERYFSCFSPCDSLRFSSSGVVVFMCICIYFLYTFYFSFENSHNRIYIGILFVIHAAADTNRSGDGSWRFE